MNNFNYTNLTPFKWFVLENFPFIEADFDALTEWQLFCKIGKEINKIIDSQNIVGEQVETLTNAFNNLKNYVDNYFNNLDVQDEINNKLNEMAEDGTLETIISKYIETYKEYTHIKGLGAIGDGITDNYELLQNIFNTYENIYIDDGIYYISQPINIKSNTSITGKGTIKGNIEIVGEIGETINYTNIEINKINTNYTFNINDLLLVYYEDNENYLNNKRQMVTTTTPNGYLSNNLCNYNNNYSIRKIESKKNIIIENITINGNIKIQYAQDITINNIKHVNGSLPISYSYNINILNSTIMLGNDTRIDGQRGSSNLTFENLKISGGNTPSDNSALKLNEVFYSNVNNCNFGSPNRNVQGYTGYFHAFMIDGNFAEDNFPINHSQFINCTNCNVTDGYTSAFFITRAKNINLDNINGNKIQIKNSNNINISNAKTNTFLNETSDNENINVSNSIIDNITQGSRQNMTLNNCVINDISLAKATDNITLINCKINKLRNAFISQESANNIIIDNCEIFEQCQLSGINKCIGKIISHVAVTINQLHNSNIDLLIVDNITNSYANLIMQSSTNNKIFYQIMENALAKTPVDNRLTPLLNKIETIKITGSNNPNNNSSISILKSNNIPTEGYYYKGQIILNSSPNSNNAIGWVCIESGTPGTWKSFGNVS